MPIIEQIFRIHEKRIVLLSHNHGLYHLDTNRGIERFYKQLIECSLIRDVLVLFQQPIWLGISLIPTLK